MLRPHVKPDWFVADRSAAQPVFGVPGLGPDKVAGLYQIHRSHLPLIESDEATRLIAELNARYSTADWEERDAITAALGFKLKRTQHQAVDFIRQRRGTLLGDEPRVGKTLAAAYSHEPALGKLVVVAPLMVREVWLSWLRRIWPGEDIGVMAGRTFDPDEACKPIVFGHYDILYGWQSGDRIGTLILDEAHALMNRHSRRTLAAVLLCSRAERVVAATGTPIWNMPTGLWSVLGLVAPGGFGGYHEFCTRYAKPEPTPYGNKYTGLSNGEELAQRLTEIMIRRRWVDVQADLPPITRDTIIVDLSMAQRRKLDIAAESLRDSAKTNTAAQLARYRDALALMKVPVTVAKAEARLTAGEPVVVWTWHKDAAEQILERLTEHGHEALLMTGDTPQNRREKIFDHWRSLPNAALIVTMSVAQVGIDLSHASSAIFGEIDYIPAIISQAEMRTFDPTRSMSVTFIVADHYVDRKIAAALASKLNAATPVDLGTGEGAIGTIDRAFRGPEEEPDLNRFIADLLAS